MKARPQGYFGALVALANPLPFALCRQALAGPFAIGAGAGESDFDGWMVGKAQPGREDAIAVDDERLRAAYFDQAHTADGNIADFIEEVSHLAVGDLVAIEAHSALEYWGHQFLAGNGLW